ncbi:xanthine dehydrogenase family protein molybdopterin-binding subunit [Massilia violaceinigra]|uniref:Xanthine dehydrogenase family protein molybdopterin-binding subunit n=1 Tax=Massilia violaceinigra TaxID=2045208 RepID=A0ABY4A5G5_9BURK|nr:xanthine dehydrogenase family protein molybdopterin-binding subunit [Massilia violaceinigra]
MTDLIDALRTPVADEGTGPVTIGMAVSRVDGRDKVTGQARYAAEHPAEGLLYGVVVSGTVTKGRIASIDPASALAVPGVVEVITHENRPRLRSFDLFYKDMTAPGGSPFRPLYDDKIHSSGQPVALVVAETFEAARYAASLVRVAYEVEQHETSLVEHMERSHKPSRLKAGYTPPPEPKGFADEMWDKAVVRMEGEYYSGVEHHNPLEMFASTVVRGDDGHLTIYDKTQSSQNSRWYVSHVFGLSKDKVTVRNPYVGGAFGSGLRPQYQLALAVMAALKLERSVRVVLTRQQMFSFGHRPETIQRVRLAARPDGTLTSIIHEALAETSRNEDYVEVVVNWSGQLYACEHIRLGYELVALDRFSPMDMRAPGAAHGVHALEVAMDELSYELKMDPLALRLHNYADIDPTDGLPYSTKELRACYQQGAARFGWAKRPLEARSMREGHELIGWGMATGMWDAMQMFARASAVLHADGNLVVSSAATDIGTGTYTAMCIIAADAMGMPLERVRFQLGDSTLPVAPIEGGSSHVATVGSAVQGVCEKLKKSLFKLARKMPDSPFARAGFEDAEFAGGGLRLIAQPAHAVSLQAILAFDGAARIEEKYMMLPNMLKQQKYLRATHSAVFVEVRVDEAFGTVRVTRVVSAIAAGRIINAKAARSQIVGGVVWGIGQALHEETQSDDRLGRFMNHNLGEYHVSVNADIHDIDVLFVEEDDRIVSRLGAKGVGEIGQVGVAAAVCNAIFHATGRRVRSTPMTPDKVMAP